MRDIPPKRCRGEIENGRESGCRNGKRRRNYVHKTVDADSDQQNDNQEVERGAQDVLFQRGSRESIVYISLDASHQEFRAKIIHPPLAGCQ